METLSKGIGLGIGFFIGFLVMLILIVLVVILISFIHKVYLRRKFTLELFLNYQSEIMKHQRFEEMEKVNQIIEKLKKEEKPGNLLNDYKVDVDSYFFWKQTYDGGEKLTYRYDKRIVRKG